MITATFAITDDRLSLDLSGHAGYAEKGRDILCSAASILAFTLAESVKNGNADIREGTAHIDCDKTDSNWQAFRVIANGYKLLATNYPDYCSYESNGALGIVEI